MPTTKPLSHRYCDGVSRRSFLRIGGLAIGATGGLHIGQLLRTRGRGETTAV